MYEKRNQLGFTGVELLLIIIILGLIIGTGWFVYHSQKATKNTLATTSSSTIATQTALATCSVAGSFTGQTYHAPANTYSICIPDGWKLYATSGGSATGSSVIASADGLMYKNGQKVVIAQTGGKDGTFPFDIFYNKPASSSPSNIPITGVVVAENVSGTTYGQTTTVDDNGMMGGVAKGTKSVEYYFSKDGKSVEIDYNQFPGDADYAAIIEQVSKTLEFN